MELVSSTVADPGGGGRGVQMHPPIEGLPLHVLSKVCANVTMYTTAHTNHSRIP